MKMRRNEDNNNNNNNNNNNETRVLIFEENSVLHQAMKEIRGRLAEERWERERRRRNVGEKTIRSEREEKRLEK